MSKIRVAAYCRVSTEKDDQLNSLENQKKYFEEYIQKHENWEFVTIYPDEGITGTSTKKRQQFNKMIADAKAGKIDLIVTKEVSRFARNTVDTLTYTRELKKMGIFVHFLIDNIQTDNTDGELRLTIMASMAQDESRKISERVKFGQGVSMKKGVVFGHSILGYNLKGGILTINEDEAKLVRRIFNDYLVKRKGVMTIAKELQEEGIKTKRNTEWSHSRNNANTQK